METIWFCLVAVMIAGYVLLDGFDIGAGIVHLFAARTDSDRRQVLRTIGPVWDGNEVWLLAAGGTLYFAFPKLYASSFSGFYLPLMVVLWLLVLRACAIELRNHFTTPTWQPFWDTTFCGASALLAIFFGAALGNVVRGVPLDENGEFFLPLWTDFATGEMPGILDWYTILVGVLAFAALTVHGSAWVAYKTEGELCSRSRRIGMGFAWATGLLTLGVTWATYSIRPEWWANFGTAPWGWIFPALALGGWVTVVRSIGRGKELIAFLGSCAYLAGMLTSVVFSLYPNVLPATTAAERNLTIHNAAAATYGLEIGLMWWIPGMLLAGGYFFFVYRLFGGKLRPDEEAATH